MNCKSGDLAICVKPNPGDDSTRFCACGTTAYLGTIIRVTDSAPDLLGRGTWWAFDRNMVTCHCGGQARIAFLDDCLRPLRDNEGEHPGDVVREEPSITANEVPFRSVPLTT